MTTSLSDLPADPMGAGGNMSVSINEKTSNAPDFTKSIKQLQQEEQRQEQQQQFQTLDQGVINQIITGLQQAGSSGQGHTQLPSRDIPQTTEHITRDAEIQPNYIPKSSNEDYIHNYEENDDIINKYNRQTNQNSNLDKLYDEIQIPLLIGILYFLFQLPIFKRYLFNYFPVLFSKDGNFNINGFFFTSTIFGLIYYILLKITNTFNKF